MDVLGASKVANPVVLARLQEKYGELLTQPGHQLWFTPRPGGRMAVPGRGMIHEPSGTVYTWPEYDWRNPEQSEGTHADRIEYTGLPQQEFARFYLRPNGVINQFAGPHHLLQQVLQADPRLAEANGFA